VPAALSQLAYISRSIAMIMPHAMRQLVIASAAMNRAILRFSNIARTPAAMRGRLDLFHAVFGFRNLLR